MDFSHRPIGVFDSGIGGLSVLQALQRQLPQERFVYLADSGHAPYGDAHAPATDAFIQQRAAAIARYLCAQHRIKALVIACNTATAAAADMLRARMPELPVIGVEPALKPAAALTRTGHVAVLATRSTLGSARFAQLRARHQRSAGRDVHFHLQACDGLARAIERSASAQEAQVQVLCTRYTRALGRFGLDAGAMDTVVLGCTHYAFAAPLLRELLGPPVRLLETGEPVARHTRHVLRQTARLAPEAPPPPQAAQPPPLLLLTTGAAPALRRAAQHWLGVAAPCCVWKD